MPIKGALLVFLVVFALVFTRYEKIVDWMNSLDEYDDVDTCDYKEDEE